MNESPVIPPVFYLAALYDGLLGLGFLFAPIAIFDLCGVTPPNHAGYVQFSAALLLVFAIMFVSIARDPIGNRRLIPYGILLKLSYCGVVFYHWLATGLPWIWKPFAIADLLFLIVFVWAYAALGKGSKPAMAG